MTIIWKSPHHSTDKEGELEERASCRVGRNLSANPAVLGLSFITKQHLLVPFLLTTKEEHESVMNARKETVRGFYKEMAIITSEPLL